MRPALFLVSCLAAFSLVACGNPSSVPDRQDRSVIYVAIGASDTVGVGATDPERDAWPAQLYARLPAGSSLVNLGVSGSLLREAIEQQLPVALAAHPDLVTVWLAVNDLNARITAEEYAAELDLLLGSLRSTRATILVGNVPDLADLPAYRGIPSEMARAQVHALNVTIATLVARHGAVLVDLNASWRGLGQPREFVAGDGFHPNTAGHARIAAEFWAAIVANDGPLGSPGG